MAYLIKQKYNWKNINQCIHEFIAKCEVCKLQGSKITNTKNRIITTTRANEMGQTDLIGPIVDQNGQLEYMIVCVDHYTKWAETAILKCKNSEKIANCIENLIIKKHGVPTLIYSDNGTEFKNSSYLQLTEEYKFKWEFKSPYHHKSTGMVEKTNQSIMNKLKKYINFGQLNWKPFLPKATFVYNLSFHTALQTSPICFKYGTSPVLPIDSSLRMPEINYHIGDLKHERTKIQEKYIKRSDYQ